jgi:serine/threonine protein phosphatase 1
MRVLAIGDIHGCTTALDALLSLVAPAPDDLLVFLGDYVDRGPDSRGAMERIIRLQASQRLVALLGNHEQLMLEARTDETRRQIWLANGGEETLRSYAGDGLASVPEEHWRFLEEQCVDWYETETHFFVHANANPHLEAADQAIVTLRWRKFDDPPPHVSGRVMVCGHTRQESGWPRNLGHAVCIDTWAYGDGWLTCLDVGSGQLWQANQSGATRTGELGKPLSAS